MDTSQTARLAGIAGIAALAGSACAVTGAALLVGSGADLDLALAEGTMASYLARLGEVGPRVVAGLSVWIVMAFLMGLAATAMTSLGDGDSVWARLARYVYGVGVAVVITAYAVWLALVIQLGGDTTLEAVRLAGALGWVGSRADWMATILVIGIGPTLVALAGRPGWVPAWLLRWSVATAVCGLLTFVAIVTGGAGLLTYGFAIVPVGVGWMVAAGVVLLRGQGRPA